MIFFGVESGSDEILRGMRKQLKSEQILALAKRMTPRGCDYDACAPVVFCLDGAQQISIFSDR